LDALDGSGPVAKKLVLAIREHLAPYEHHDSPPYCGRMMHDKYSIYARNVQPRPADELAAERREQIALEQAALQAGKQRNLVRQRAIDTTPETRIALWETRHGLALPRDPKHPLMQFIADSTDLDIVQVQAEQSRRAIYRKAENRPA
jgi:hypothetical protein